MGGGKAPKPSPQENALKAQQTALLQQQGDLLRESVRRQDLLAPILFKQAGLTPQYDEAGQITGFTEGPETPEQAAAKREAAFLEKQARLQDLLFPHQLRSLGLQATYDSQGNPLSISEAPLDEAGQLRKDAEIAFLRRQGAALRGELPVDPALINDLNDQDALLRETLQRRIGGDYETSTPGIEALSKFGKRREEILTSARRGDLVQAGALAGEANARIYGAQDNAFRAASILGTPTIQAASALSPLASGGRSAANLATYLGIVNPGGGQGGGLGTLGSLAEQLGTVSGQLGAQRLQQFQLDEQRRQEKTRTASSLGGTIGTVAGGLIGTYVFPAIGTAGGAAIGGAAGSAIGYGIGS